MEAVEELEKSTLSSIEEVEVRYRFTSTFVLLSDYRENVSRQSKLGEIVNLRSGTALFSRTDVKTC